jgi:hypothetical protein
MGTAMPPEPIIPVPDLTGWPDAAVGLFGPLYIVCLLILYPPTMILYQSLQLAQATNSLGQSLSVSGGPFLDACFTFFVTLVVLAVVAVVIGLVGLSTFLAAAAYFLNRVFHRSRREDPV